MAANSLVVGIGNRLLGADAFGPAVIEALRHVELPDGTELLDAYTDLLGHIDRFPSFATVIIVDAIIDEGQGEIVEFDDGAFTRWTVDSPTGHEISAALAVALFRKLHPAAPTRISLVGYDVPEVRHGTAVPPEKIDAAVRLIRRLLAA